MYLMLGARGSVAVSTPSRKPVHSDEGMRKHLNDHLKAEESAFLVGCTMRYPVESYHL